MYQFEQKLGIEQNQLKDVKGDKYILPKSCNNRIYAKITLDEFTKDNTLKPLFKS